MLSQLSELGWKASPAPRAHPPRSSPAPGGLVGGTGGVGKTRAGARRMAGKAGPAQGEFMATFQSPRPRQLARPLHLPLCLHKSLP